MGGTESQDTHVELGARPDAEAATAAMVNEN